MRSPYDIIDQSAEHDWRMDAACLQVAPEVFFPVGVSDPAVSSLRQAKRVCNGCSVQDACLHWAQSIGISGEVGSGLNEEERRSLKRRARRQLHG